jgi:Fur family peroxide stress response transcriptional regulator
MSERYSRQREAIREELNRRRDHPTASEIYDAVRKKYPHISMGTVYRNLTEMKNAGEVIVIETTAGSGNCAARYDGDTSDHCHFACLKCGSVSDIYIDGCSDLVREAEKQSGGKINQCSVTFTGLCSKCAKQSDSIDE